MATTFEITVVHGDPHYARQAMQAAFAELDLIEGHLSRFVEGSDVFRLNRLARGHAALVHLETWECLRIAEEVRRATGGAFDVAYGSANPPAAGPRLELDAHQPSVRVLSDGVRVDLGGIGKGFALDRMALVLREWDIDRARLCASTSTILALGAPPGEPGWPVRLGFPLDGRRLVLVHRALSSSGTAVKGNHILDPHTGLPAAGRRRVWAEAPAAAVADALSTAFMVMTPRQIELYCARHPDVAAWLDAGSTDTGRAAQNSRSSSSSLRSSL